MENPNPAAFDPLAGLYDLFQDWERRLPREIRRLADLFERHGVRTVLDAACGTGAHLEALARRGYEVAGSDLSREMIDRARARLGGDAELRAIGFEEVGAAFAPRDAVIVVGNSLPNAGDLDAVRRSLASLARAVRPGGLLVLHLLNYPRLVARGGGLSPVRRVAADGREHLFLKLFEIHANRVVLDVIALTGEDGAWTSSLTRSELCPIPPGWLRAELGALGFGIVAETAGFATEPFSPETSGDLLVVAQAPRSPSPL